MKILYETFYKALDPQTPVNELLTIMDAHKEEEVIKWALLTQKKLTPNDYPIEWKKDLAEFIPLKHKDYDSCVFKLLEKIPSSFEPSVFNCFTHNETITNHFLKKNKLFFETYINSIFKKSSDKDLIFQCYELISKMDNPQKYILKLALDKQQYLAIVDQKKIPAWTLDEITASVIERSKDPEYNFGIDIKDFINNYLIDNRNLSVDSAISLLEAFPEFCNYAKAFKIKHRHALEFVKSRDNFTSLRQNLKLKEKTFYALFEMAKKESDVRRKNIFLVLSQNPLCPSPIIKAMSSEFKTGDKTFFKKMDTVHINPSTLPTLLKNIGKENRNLYFMHSNLPEEYLRDQKRYLKNQKLLLLQESIVDFEKVKAIGALLSEIQIRLQSSSIVKNKVAALF